MAPGPCAVTATLGGSAGIVSWGYTMAQLPLWGGGELSNFTVVVHNHNSKCFQPQLCDACCRVTIRSKTVLRPFHVLLHAAENTWSYKPH